MKSVDETTMQYIVNDPLLTLPLSRRARSILGKAGINTADKILDCSIESLLELQGMGFKSFAEIILLRESLSTGKGKNISLRQEHGRPALRCGKKNSPPFIGPDGLLYQDIPLEDLGLSCRALGALIQHGVRYASELIGATMTDLMAVPGLGARCSSEIMRAVSSIEFVHAAVAIQDNTSLGGKLRSLARELSIAYGGSVLSWESRIFRVLSAHGDIEYDDIVASLYEEEFALNALSSFLSQKLGSADIPDDRAQLAAMLPQHLQMLPNVVNNAAERLMAVHNIKNQKTKGRKTKEQKAKEQKIKGRKSKLFDETLCLPKIMHLMDYVQSIRSETHRSVLIDRLNGLTLSEIGKRHGGLCRERIRQIERDALNGRPEFFEDKYLYVFDAYRFSLSDFTLAFCEPEYVYYYLVLATRWPGEKNKELKDALSDENIPDDIKQRIACLCYKDNIFLEGEIIECSRHALIKWLLEHRCKTAAAAVDVIYDMYHQVLRDNNIPLEKMGITNTCSLEAHMSRQENVLCGINHTFRYYDMSNTDRFRGLIAALDLESYDGLEISSLLLFRKHPDLMRQYELQNHYELHNLLRKLPSLLPDKVKIGRMPTIFVGSTDRRKQMLDLLLANAPIDVKDLAQKYEDLYGGDAGTFATLYTVFFCEYNHRGTMYKADGVLLDDRAEKMKSLLTKGIYSLQEVEELFQRVFPGASFGDLSASSFKLLGFHYYSSFILKDTYKNLSEYILEHAPRTRPFPIDEVFPGERSSSTFQYEFYKLRASYTLIETGPGFVCHIDYLRSHEFTIEDIKSYCDAVHAFVPADSFFTIYSLRRDGFHHPLDALDFGDWFYASILQADSSRFKYRKIGNAKYLFHGQKDSLSLDFLKSAVSDPALVSSKVLGQAISEKYGIAITPNFLLSVKCSLSKERTQNKYTT